MAGINWKLKKRILWTLVIVLWQELIEKLKKTNLWTLVNVLWQDLMEKLKKNEFCEH